MGHKPSNNFQSNRPESGGANHDEKLEKSGILEREKEKLGASRGNEPPQELPRKRDEGQEGPPPRELERDDRSDDRDPGHS